uniref:Reverse transcriptase Ty1/copia-type domain-containing protein n=1 Tax=Nicotiana tabacum TaxID=4097 RepID=A0A1S4AVM6_TOBAC|nr:PREDICTED: uncharacterized protein LOC107801782 [Nicotiana tabacum]
MGKRWNRNNVIVDNNFAYNVAVEVMQQDGDLEPKSIDECRRRNDWPKWKDAIQVELASLEKHEVFGPIVQTLEGVKPVGYKWVFVRKQNEKGEIIRHKARLVAQGFSQRHDIDYMETYSPVVDAITFRYLINLAVHEKLDMRLMDVVTTYLYGSLDNEIFMKIPEGFKHEVFGPIVQTPEGVKPVGYKWVFVRKQNEKGEIIRHKARLVAQGFSQRHDIDYMETYSPVVDAITFRYLINLAVHEKLDMRLMDVVTTYLYGSLDNEIFMKIPEGFKHEVFGPIVQTPEGVKPVGYKWVFVRKQNEKGEIIRHKARLVAQGFSQRHDIDYMETYSPVVDAITFRYLINLAVHEKLDMRLMDVVTTYLYGSLDNEIFMKIPEGFKHEVFGPIVQTPEGVKPVGYKWVFVRKQNEKGEIIRHKA